MCQRAESDRNRILWNHVFTPRGLVHSSDSRRLSPDGGSPCHSTSPRTDRLSWAGVCWGLESITVRPKQVKPVLGSGCCFSWEAQALGWSLKNNLFSPPDYKRKWKRKNTTSLKYIKYISKECPMSLLMCWKVFIVTMLGLSGILKGHSLVWGDGLIGGIILRREI